MTEHDPMCPQYDQTERTIAMFDTPCRCEEYARVRADEREQAPCWVVYGHGHYAKALADLASAEAVAAKLVEVICEQERELSAPWHLRLWRCGKCGLDWMPVGEDRTCPRCDLRTQIAADIEALPIYATRIGYEWLSPGGWQPSDRVISTVLRSDAARIARGES